MKMLETFENTAEGKNRAEEIDSLIGKLGFYVKCALDDLIRLRDCKTAGPRSDCGFYAKNIKEYYTDARSVKEKLLALNPKSDEYPISTKEYHEEKLQAIKEALETENTGSELEEAA